MTEFFASVPDRCPDCDEPLDASVDLTDDGEGLSGHAVTDCPECGWSERYQL